MLGKLASGAILRIKSAAFSQSELVGRNGGLHASGVPEGIVPGLVAINRDCSRQNRIAGCAELRGFSDVGNDGPLHALGRLASEKRQGTKTAGCGAPALPQALPLRTFHGADRDDSPIRLEL